MINKDTSLKAYLSRLQGEGFGFKQPQQPENPLARAIARMRASEREQRDAWLGQKGVSIGSSKAFGTGVAPLALPQTPSPFLTAHAVFILAAASVMVLHGCPWGWVFLGAGGALLLFSLAKWVSHSKPTSCVRRTAAAAQCRLLLTLPVLLFLLTIAMGYIFKKVFKSTFFNLA